MIKNYAWVGYRKTQSRNCAIVYGKIGFVCEKSEIFNGDPLDSMRTVRAAHQVPHSDANVITLHML